MNGNCSGFFPRVAREDVHFPEIDLAECHAHALTRGRGRQADAAADKRQALDAHQLVANDRGGGGLEALLEEVLQAPIALEQEIGRASCRERVSNCV